MNIPVGRLVASHVVSPTTVFLVLATIAVIVGVSQGVTWLLFGFVPALIGVGAYWVRSILRSLRYSIAPTPDGVRITFGLLTTVTEIVPPGRIHAVEVTQPILWRPAGWWIIRINRLSGRSATDANTDQFTTVLPVGTAADVERVLRLRPAVRAGGGVAAHRAGGHVRPGEGDTSRRRRGAPGSSARCRGAATASASPRTRCCCDAASCGASWPSCRSRACRASPCIRDPSTGCCASARPRPCRHRSRVRAARRHRPGPGAAAVRGRRARFRARRLGDRSHRWAADGGARGSRARAPAADGEPCRWRARSPVGSV